jgi:hypothetical protein
MRDFDDIEAHFLKGVSWKQFLIGRYLIAA